MVWSGTKWNSFKAEICTSGRAFWGVCHGLPRHADVRGPGFQMSPLQADFCSGPCKQNTGENGLSGAAFIEQQGFLKVWCWPNARQEEDEPPY